MLRFYLFRRGNLTDLHEFVHVRRVIHFGDLPELIERLLNFQLGLHPAWLQKHVEARIRGELRSTLAVAVHGQHGTIDLPWRNAVCQPLQHTVIQAQRKLQCAWLQSTTRFNAQELD